MGKSGSLIHLSVRDLCEKGFSSDPGRTGSGWIPGRARQGQKAHRRIQDEFLCHQPECKVEYDLNWQGKILEQDVSLSGRADLVLTDGKIVEIKTLLIQPERFKKLTAKDFPAPAMQALLYAWMYKPDFKLMAILRLVNIVDGSEMDLEVKGTSREILVFLENQIALYTASKEQENRLHKLRLKTARDISFPFDEYRKGQRVLLNDVENAIQRNEVVLLNAPTGLGKSVSVLVPALKQAFRSSKRVFFCTAKNTGQEAAINVVMALENKGCRVSTIAMASRENMCTADTYFCHEEHCPFLSGMKARMTDALKELEPHLIVNRDLLVKTGLKHRVCPHEIGLSLCEQRDLVVGDYNHALDPRIRIRRLFIDGDPDQFVILVDEAHNLAARARSWFSTELSYEYLVETETHLAGKLAVGDLFNSGPLHDSFTKMLRIVKSLQKQLLDYSSQIDEDFVFDRDSKQTVLGAQFDLRRFQKARSRYEQVLIEYMLTSVMIGASEGRDPLVSFYYELDNFCNLLEMEKESIHQVIRLCREEENNITFELVCSWAGDWLSEKLPEFHSAVLFSATLKPWEFHLRELGLNVIQKLSRVEASSPFPEENRLLVIHSGFSSRFRDRPSGMNALAAIVSGVFDKVAANCAVFLPSFNYLRQLRGFLPKGIPLLVHDGSMDIQLRQAILTRLKNGPPKLLLTVMGGVFAEAVDYPGTMLENAIVVSPGLPLISHERELARIWYESCGDSGFDFAYRLPGLCRVLQAAGRIIRRNDDRGSIVFLCDRFSEWDNMTVLENYYQQKPDILEYTDELLKMIETFHLNRGQV
jgi:DNA excision repair protein ERCC-2